MSLDALIAGIAAERADERGAARACRGHARSPGDAPEAAAIRRIEDEARRRRAALGGRLADLGGRPSAWREPLMAAIGAVIGAGFHVIGWLLPRVGAGLIERANVAVYRRLVRLAEAAGRPDLAAELAALGQVEVDHAAFFFGQVGRHAIGRRLPRRLVALTPAEAAAFSARATG